MSADPSVSPWKTIPESCTYAKCGRKVLYGAIANGRLRAARIDGRRAIRIHTDWLDEWLQGAAPLVVEIPRRSLAS